MLSVQSSNSAFSESLMSANEVLSPYMPVFFAAFVVSFLVTPIVRYWAIKKGIVDWPDFNRKAHLQPVAYLGGIALFFGWLAGVGLCFFIKPHDLRFFSETISHVSFPVAIVIGAVVIVVVGLVDDIHGLSPRMKLGGQLFAAAALATQDAGTSLMMDFFRGFSLNFPHMELVAYVLGAVFIVLLVLGGCNSMNLVDGLDGLAAGVGAIAAMGLLFISIHIAIDVSAVHGQASGLDVMASPVRMVMCLALLGTVLGFLPYNFNPANIFMGDTGSMLLGYLCVSTILLFAHAPGAGVSLVMAGLMVFALPITETTLSIVRRKVAGKSIFTPDKEHLHHRFQAAGLTIKQTVLSLYAISFLFAILGCSMVFLRWRFVMAVFMVFACFLGITAYKSGHNKLLLKQQNPYLANLTNQEKSKNQTDPASTPKQNV